jgi:hypothetical protein
MKNNQHMIPQLILDIVSDMKKANASSQLFYEQRLIAIRDYVSTELENFKLKPFFKSSKGSKRP